MAANSERLSLGTAVSSLLALLRKPSVALVLTNTVTAGVLLYALSEGRPLRALRRLLWRAALAAVPRSLVDRELGSIKRKLERDLIGSSLDGESLVLALPDAGWTRAAVGETLARYGAADAALWRSGRISGCVYHGGDDLADVQTDAFRLYAISNPLHPDVFPRLRKMEAEVVAMTLALFHGTPECCGTMTSGGTESILMAVKAYRDLARSTRGVLEPELVAPVTAHAAFDKACAYFGIKLVHVPVDAATFKVDVAAAAAAINANTIALVCSAPCYAQGVVDPVEDMAARARAAGLPLHVDCCLGSFLIPFADEVRSRKLPLFDFRVPGVTSISCDPHKYGFAPKGASVIMYANEALRHAQYFVAPEWTGGIYASPSIAGSRPGALIAACWATMVHLGADGYRASARTILDAAAGVAAGIAARVPALRLLGDPDLSVVCFAVAADAAGAGLSIYNVGDEMKARGWNLNTLQNPASIHLCVTVANAERAASAFVDDLAAAVAAVRAAPAGTYKNGSGAIYGMAESIEDKSLVNEVAWGFLDTLYKATKVEAKA